MCEYRYIYSAPITYVFGKCIPPARVTEVTKTYL